MFMVAEPASLSQTDEKTDTDKEDETPSNRRAYSNTSYGTVG